MKFVLIFIGVLFSIQAMAQLQAQTLGTESLNNTKSIVVGNLNQPNGIKVKVVSSFVGEPAIFPFRLHTYIQCKNERGFKVMDVAKIIRDHYPDQFSRNIAAPNSRFRNGVLQVCALDNVNYDSEKIFITIFEPGSEHCDRSKVMDLIFPIQEFCEK